MERTALFIHGAWMNAECWDRIARRFRERGWLCLTPSWPHNERSVGELRDAPDADYAGVGIDEVLKGYEAVIRGLPRPPLLVGHSFGGYFAQLLLARGLGYAGVAMTPAPQPGSIPNLAIARANWPVLSTWGGHRRVLRLSSADFRTDWAHLETDEDAATVYERLVVPTPGRPFFQLAFGATRADWKVPATGARLPLLVVGADDDRTVPSVYHREAAERWGERATFRSFPRRTHLLFWQQGWEEIADLCIEFGDRARAEADRLARTPSGRFIAP